MLLAIPTYFLFLFRMPSGVIKELEKIMRNFLWKEANGDGGITWFLGRRLVERSTREVWVLGG